MPSPELPFHHRWGEPGPPGRDPIALHPCWLLSGFLPRCFPMHPAHSGGTSDPTDLASRPVLRHQKNSSRERWPEHPRHRPSQSSPWDDGVRSARRLRRNVGPAFPQHGSPTQRSCKHRFQDVAWDIPVKRVGICARSVGSAFCLLKAKGSQRQPKAVKGSQRQSSHHAGLNPRGQNRGRHDSSATRNLSGFGCRGLRVVPLPRTYEQSACRRIG